MVDLHFEGVEDGFALFVVVKLEPEADNLYLQKELTILSTINSFFIRFQFPIKKSKLSLSCL